MFSVNKTVKMIIRISALCLLLILSSINCNKDVEVRSEEDVGVKYANRCEVCKILTTELQARLEETGKIHDVIEIGYSLDDVQPKKRTKYEKSELRLIESLEGLCDRILEYNMHKEREDSTRFAKGMSQTFKTLHGLVDKGVKVDLGIPLELWDKPSAEITHMKAQCESLLEENESVVEDWYWNHQGTVDLMNYFCTKNALRGTDDSCLYEKVEDKKVKADKYQHEYRYVVEDWYRNHQGTVDLMNYLCTKNALRGTDDSCLLEKVEDMKLKGDKSEL